MNRSGQLYALQQLDLELDAHRAALERIRAELEEPQAWRQAQEELREAEGEGAALERRRKDLEAEVLALEAKIQPLERKLYDGSIRNPKELADLERDVKSLKARHSALEDRVLELMEQGEALERLMAERRAHLRTLEGDWQRRRGEVLKEQEREQKDLARLQGERAALIAHIEGTALALYESLRESRQGRAVTMVERGTCQGCRIALPSTELQRARNAELLVQCSSCQRILYLA